VLYRLSECFRRIQGKLKTDRIRLLVVDLQIDIRVTVASCLSWKRQGAVINRAFMEGDPIGQVRSFEF